MKYLADTSVLIHAERENFDLGLWLSPDRSEGARVEPYSISDGGRGAWIAELVQANFRIAGGRGMSFS